MQDPDRAWADAELVHVEREAARLKGRVDEGGARAASWVDMAAQLLQARARESHHQDCKHVRYW